MIDTHELAWAAGFFDGEGYIKTMRGKRKSDPQRFVYRNIILDVRQVDRRALDRFQAALGGIGHIYGPWKNKGPNRKEFYCYSLAQSLQVQEAVRLLWPWLGPVKREQATREIAAWKTEPRLRVGRKAGWGRKPECHPEREHKALGKCNACYLRHRKAVL